MKKPRIYVKCSCNFEIEGEFDSTLELFESHILNTHKLKPVTATFMKSARLQI